MGGVGSQCSKRLLLVAIWWCLVALLRARADEALQTVCQRRETGTNICPELFIIGIQKSGSSSLFEWLVARNPQIQIAASAENWKRKETHYFDMYHGRGTNWYSSLYPVRNSSSDVAMDGTPCYSRYWYVPERMKKDLDLPKLRMIISFRDPVARAFSWYAHVMAKLLGNKQGFVQTYRAFDFSFTSMTNYVAPVVKTCVDRRTDDLVHRYCSSDNLYYRASRFVPQTNSTVTSLRATAALLTDGLYGHILLHWFQYFSPDQFCVVFFDNLVADFSSEMQHAKPCVGTFGLNADVPSGEAMPVFNRRPCPNCEVYEGQARLEHSKYLDEMLFTKSLELLDSLTREHYGRSTPRWDLARK